jgi:hypothetical protein
MAQNGGMGTDWEYQENKKQSNAQIFRTQDIIFLLPY